MYILKHFVIFLCCLKLIKGNAHTTENMLSNEDNWKKHYQNDSEVCAEKIIKAERKGCSVRITISNPIPNDQNMSKAALSGLVENETLETTTVENKDRTTKVFEKPGQKVGERDLKGNKVPLNKEPSSPALSVLAENETLESTTVENKDRTTKVFEKPRQEVGEKDLKGDKKILEDNILDNTTGASRDRIPYRETANVEDNKYTDALKEADRGSLGPPEPVGPPGLSEPIGPALPNVPDPEGSLGVDIKPASPQVMGNLGEKTNPLDFCSQIEDSGRQKYYINKMDPFEVTCDYENNRTYYLKSSKSGEYAWKRKNWEKEFWLTDAGFQIKALYNDDSKRTLSRLNYLRQISSRGTQKLTIYCKNMIISKVGVEDKSLQILLWNNVLIGARKTASVPVAYKVLSDNCGTEAGKAEIEISTYSSNLPVIDFYVRDIREDQSQSISVEVEELYFNYYDF